MVNPISDQYFQDNFYFISILDSGKPVSEAKNLLCSTYHKIKMLYIQTFQACLKKLEIYSRILIHMFILVSLSYLKLKRSLSEKLLQV